MKKIFNKNNITSSIVAATFIATLSSTSVYAHDDSCDVNLNAGFSIDEGRIEFLDEENNSLYKIMNDEKLIVSGEHIDLTSNQQLLVHEYSTNIRALVPEIKSVAIEGVDLALEAVNLVFTELLGEGNNVGDELTQELSSLKEEVSTRFSIADGFTIGADGLNGDELLGDEFEERIETVVETAVMNSMGSLLVALGQEMLFSGGDTDAFETKMESFGENIEHEMENRAEKIERKAEKLCIAIVEIDELEEQLKASIKPLANIDVISTKINHSDEHSM